tara:strand:- start:215 stop:388 length:174 start_codon:yes stop_codon:yes gene_type:complete
MLPLKPEAKWLVEAPNLGGKSIPEGQDKAVDEPLSGKVEERYLAPVPGIIRKAYPKK